MKNKHMHNFKGLNGKVEWCNLWSYELPQRTCSSLHWFMCKVLNILRDKDSLWKSLIPLLLNRRTNLSTACIFPLLSYAFDKDKWIADTNWTDHINSFSFVKESLFRWLCKLSCERTRDQPGFYREFCVFNASMYIPLKYSCC